jgi:hypothetical protein
VPIHTPTDPVSRADLRALEREDHVQRIVAEAPEFTDEQCEYIAAILLTGGAA